MFKRLKNNKGIVPAGILFAGGNPVGSIVAVVMIAAAIYVPYIADNSDFRQKKANILCEQGYKGVTCAEVAQMNKEEILAYIKDDIVAPQYQMAERLGG